MAITSLDVALLSTPTSIKVEIDHLHVRFEAHNGQASILVWMHLHLRIFDSRSVRIPFLVSLISIKFPLSDYRLKHVDMLLLCFVGN